MQCIQCFAENMKIISSGIEIANNLGKKQKRTRTVYRCKRCGCNETKFGDWEDSNAD